MQTFNGRHGTGQNQHQPEPDVGVEQNSNMSMEDINVHVPAAWKMTKLVVIFKKGNQKTPCELSADCNIAYDVKAIQRAIYYATRRGSGDVPPDL